MDRLTRTVREQVALGRLLPLGGPGDAAWITERAVVRALRRSCAGLPDVRLGEVGVALGEGDGNGGPEGASAGVSAEVSAAAPVGALPHLPLRVEADFEAAAGEPLPVVADRLRDTLGAAAGGLGLVVEAVDLRVTGLLDGTGAPSGAGDDEEGTDGRDGGDVGDVGGPDQGAVEAAARAVPGVLRLTRRLAGFGAGVRVRDTEGAARVVQVQIAVGAGAGPLDVAREVVAAVTRAALVGAPGPVTATLLVTDLS